MLVIDDPRAYPDVPAECVDMDRVLYRLRAYGKILAPGQDAGLPVEPFIERVLADRSCPTFIPYFITDYLCHTTDCTMFQRDPLSVRYDPTAAQVMIRAIRASRNGTGVQVWIASSRAELRSPDAGGRTAHERAFTRAAYYLVWRAPLNAGRIPDWSLKVTWGDELRPSSGGRMARPARLRIFPRRGPRGGRQHAYALPESRQWARNEGLRSGGIGSGRERF